jgi:hypothetical protein
MGRLHAKRKRKNEIPTKSLCLLVIQFDRFQIESFT